MSGLEAALEAPPLGSAIRCNHVQISVADLDASVAWYEEKLDLRCVRRFSIPAAQARFALVRGAVGGPMIEIASGPWTERNPHAYGDQKDQAKIQGTAHFAFEVDDCAAVEAELRRRGVNIVKPTHDAVDAGMRCAFFHDLEGTVFELVEPLDS